MKLEGIRNKIDKIDRELLVLLQERMGLALRSRKFQESGAESKQEEDTLARMKRLNLDLVKSSFSRLLLKTIIDESKGSMALTAKLPPGVLSPTARTSPAWSLSMYSKALKPAISIWEWFRWKTLWKAPSPR